MQNTYMNKMLQRIADAVERWTGGSITIDVTGAGDMQGATASAAGVHGLVPAPAEGDQNKVLSGAGTWIDAGGGELVDLEDVTITSPTSGESLKYDGTKWVNGNVTAELPDFIEETSGSIVTVEAAERPAKSLVVDIEPQQDLHGYDRPWVGGAGKNKLNPDIRKYGSPYAVWGGELTSNTPNGDLTLDVGTYTFSLNESAKQINVRDNPESVIVRVYSTNVMTFTIDQRKAVKIAVELRSGQNINSLNFQLESGNQATSWQPYSNICPISGCTGCNVVVSPSIDAEDGQTYTITFPSEAGTVYGGTLDVVNGVLTVTKANVASYDGETLPGAWISDRDVYAEGTTPTTGAQVVYDLDTPITYQLTPTEVQMLLGTNNIWADTGEITELKYINQTYNDLLKEVGVTYKNRASVDTGEIWIDGNPIKVFTLYYNGLSGSSNRILLSDFGFTDTINSIVDIKTLYKSNVNGETHSQGAYCYSWYIGGWINTYINMDGTIYIRFYYT